MANAVSMKVRAAGGRRSASRSATRALDVLELFGDMRRPLRAIEVAQAMAMSASSTNQLLKTMVDSAHLVFDARTKNYAPSPRLARFAGWMVAHHAADQPVRGLMDALVRRSGETVTLATPDDLFMLILDRAGGRAGDHGPERGLRVSIFGSALGHAYLSAQPAAEVRRLAIRARLTEREFADVADRVAQARRDGIAQEAAADGAFTSLAAPLPRAAHPAPLVLALAGPTERIDARLGELCDLMLGLLADGRAG